MNDALNITQEGNAVILHLLGVWEAPDLGAVERSLRSTKLPAGASYIINGSGLSALDSSGAWLLVAWLRRHLGVKAQLELRGFSEAQQGLLALMEKLEHPASAEKAQSAAWQAIPEQVGYYAVDFFHGISGMVAFFGRLCITAWAMLLHPARWRMQSTVYHLYRHGICAVPIIALMAFLISIVTGYQGANQLQKFGADVFTVDLVAISLLREMGVLITAIMVAGRSGSSFAAQIGVMQVNQEVDALRSFGLDPYEMLVLPRVVALVIALPLLTFISDIVGLAGAWVMAATLLDMSWLQFLTRLDVAITSQTFMIGISKAPAFGFLIALVGCQRGMLVKSSADQVGMQTTMAVVQAIFLVLMFDAIFSIIFTMMDI